MKRVLSLVIVALLVLSFSACGSVSTGDLQEPSGISSNNGNSNENQTATPQEATITETVLVDEAGVKITAKSLDTKGFMGPEIKLLIENNSGKDLTFQCRNASVNGYMVEPMMSVDVVNGKKANDSLTFMNSDLELCGITEIADMEFSFYIFTTADWEDYLETPLIQLKTSLADSYQYTYDDSGDVAYEGNGVKIVVKGLSEDMSIMGPSVVVYIENTGDKDVTVQTRDVSVNGFMLDPIFSCDIGAGKHAVDTITFMSSDFEENGISAIESLELSFHIFDFDSWDTIVDTDVISLTF